METFDIVVIGSGYLARRIVRELAQKKKKVALALFGEPVDTRFYELQRWLIKGAPASLEEETIPSDVPIFEGPAQFISPNYLHAKSAELKARRFILATGAGQSTLHPSGFEGIHTLTACEVMTADLPNSVVIVGDVPIGVSIAGQLAQKGKKVTLLCSGPHVPPHEEPELGEALILHLEHMGIHVERGFKNMDMRKYFGETMILATGFKPQTDGLALDKARVYVQTNGAVVVNDLMQTSSPRILAAGSVTGTPIQLTKETYQADLIIHNLTSSFFDKKRWDYDPIPVTYPTPLPFASVGKMESEARERYRDIRVSLTPFVVNEKAQLQNNTGGLIKLVGRKKNGTLLGAHIVGPGADEMILTFNLAMRAGISVYDLIDRHHFPKLSYGEMVVKSLIDLAEILD